MNAFAADVRHGRRSTLKFWFAATLITLLYFVVHAPSAYAYACSDPYAQGEIDAVGEGWVRIKVWRSDNVYPLFLAPLRVYFRGGEGVYMFQPQPYLITLSTMCMTEASELRVVPLDCYNDEHVPGTWTTTIDAGSTKPTIRLGLDKAIDPATNTMRRKATVTWDLGYATDTRSLRADLLPWKNADGTVVSGGPLWTPTSFGRTGTTSFFFDAPSGAQQFTVRATAQSCTGKATKEVSIDCAPCDEGATKDPVYFNDGNVRVIDSDPLPPIAGHTLSRTYNSDEKIVAPFGRGWTTLFDRRAIVNADGAEDVVSIVTAANEVITFRGTASAGYRQTWPLTRTANDHLTYDSASSSYRHRAVGATELAIFRASDGRLIELRSLLSGRSASIAYDTAGLPTSFTDSWSGISWNFTVDSTRRLVTSIGVSGRSDLTWTYVYDSSRNLTAVEAPGPDTWRSYEYTSNRMVASRDSAGALIESHTYDSNGFGTSSTGPSDEIASIQYNIATTDPDARITRVTENNGNVIDYLLRSSGGAWRTVEVIGGCGSCGSRDATFVRDENGKIIRRQSATGYVTTSTYGTGERLMSTVSALKPVGCDPATSSTACRYDAATLATISLEPTAATVTTQFEYSDSNWPDRATAVIVPSVVATGQSRRQDISYHPVTGDVVSQSTQGWTTTSTSVTRSSVTTFYGDSSPDPFEPAFEPGGVFSSSWLALPQPNLMRRTVDGPRTDVSDITSFVYYPIDSTVPATLRGRLAAVKSAAGHVTRFETYDVFGNVTRSVDPNGVATERTFDGLGRVLTTTIKAVPGCSTAADALCATDLTTTREYVSEAGQLLHEIRPGGGTTAYTYDSRGRVHTVSRGPSATDLRERSEVTYDSATGKKNLEKTLAYESGVWSEKRRESYTYDSHARLQTMVHADSTSVAYTYDAADRVLTVRDENHTSPNTAYAYDPAGRLSKVTQTLSGVTGGVITQYAYDRHGNLTTVIDPKTNTTSYEFDDFGQMTSQQSPVSGLTEYSYDIGGNLVETADANGASTIRTYDALGRVLSATSSRTSLPTEVVTWTYDDISADGFGIGRLASLTDPSGTTAYSYERRGLLRSEWNEELFTGGTYNHDADGNRTTLGLAQYLFDFAGRAVAVSVGESTIVDQVKYLPFGPATEWTYGNGAVKTTDYDTRYRVTRNKLALLSTVIADYVYDYDNAGNITEILDDTNHGYDRTFSYDDLNRLVSANTGSALWGTGTYAYDVAGNPTSVSLGTSRSAALSYSGTTSKLTSVNSFAVTYDAAGNENEEVSARNQIAMGEGHYVYDGRGVRVHEYLNVPQTESPFSRTWTYTPELQLLSFKESAFRSQTTVDYVWLNGAPVGQLSSGGVGIIFEDESAVLRYTFTDHLGTPLLQMIGSDVVWRAEYEPYGRIFDMRIGNKMDQRLRMPGQEVLVETDGDEYYYNIFRWYRPGWGRYTTPDPLGLAPDTNNFRYAANRPIVAADRLGLFCTKDFVLHYLGRSGTAIDLKAVGLLSTFISSPSVGGAIDTELTANVTIAKNHAKQACAGCPNGNLSGSFKSGGDDVFVNVFADNTPCVGWPIGSTILSVWSNCKWTANCTAKTFKVTCKSDWKLRDRFTNPLSQGEPGGNPGKPNDLLGVPYDIVADWSVNSFGGGSW